VRVGVELREVDDDQQVGWVRLEGAQEVSFRAVAVSGSQGRDPAEILDPPRLRRGRPSFARFENFQTFGVTTLFHQVARSLELALADVPENAGGGGYETHGNEHDLFRPGEPARELLPFRCTRRRACLRLPKHTSNHEEDEEHPSEQQQLAGHSRGDANAREDDHAIGKGPERKLVCGLCHVKNVVECYGNQSNEKDPRERNSRYPKEECAQDREYRSEEGGVGDEMRRSVSREAENFTDDVRRVGEEDGHEAPQFPH